MNTPMFYTIVVANDVVADAFTSILEAPAFVVMHEKESMLAPEVLVAMVEKWRATFHPSELPIVATGEDDATDAFLYWLEEQPLGYFVPSTSHGVCSLPIFDEEEHSF